MVKLIKLLQIAFIALFAVLVGYDFFLQGIAVFAQRYVLLSGFFLIMLELSLLVIVKLIEDD